MNLRREIILQQFAMNIKCKTREGIFCLNAFQDAKRKVKKIEEKADGNKLAIIFSFLKNLIEREFRKRIQFLQRIEMFVGQGLCFTFLLCLFLIKSPLLFLFSSLSKLIKSFRGVILTGPFRGVTLTWLFRGVPLTGPFRGVILKGPFMGVTLSGPFIQYMSYLGNQDCLIERAHQGCHNDRARQGGRIERGPFRIVSAQGY